MREFGVSFFRSVQVILLVIAVVSIMTVVLSSIGVGALIVAAVLEIPVSMIRGKNGN